MNRAVTLTQCSHCNKQNKSLEPPEGKQLPGEVKVPRSHQILQRLEFYRSPHPHPARLSGVTPGVLTGRRGRGDRGCGERRGAGAGGSSNRLASVRHRRAGVWVCWWCFRLLVVFPFILFWQIFPFNSVRWERWGRGQTLSEDTWDPRVWPTRHLAAAELLKLRSSFRFPEMWVLEFLNVYTLTAKHRGSLYTTKEVGV